MLNDDQLTPCECWALLRTARHGHLAGTDAEGAPIVRTLHHAILDGSLYFHGHAGGRKLATLGRPGVFECVDALAAIPSYWIDPERACPATTYYRSVQVSGRLEQTTDPEEKARALTALMAKLQPEGRHVPITAEERLYRGPLRSLLVFKLAPDALSGKCNFGRRRTAPVMHRILRGLWDRGSDGDLRAIEAILERRTDLARPDWLTGPAGTVMTVCPTPALAEEAAALLRDQYWNGPYDVEELALAQCAASAWVGVRDPRDGRLVATAAALANRSKHAWVYDVAVAPSHRGNGVGTAMLHLLMDHPAVRGARLVSLRTLDAHEFYRRFGFMNAAACDNPTGASTMLWVRRSPA